MQPLSQINIGQIISYARDLSIAATVIAVGWKILRAISGIAWKARGIWEEIQTFIHRITQHMETMENGMKVVLENHLTHIEDHLANLAVSASRIEEPLETLVDAQVQNHESSR